MPRARSRHEILPAAAYVGVGATKFDQMVDDGRMPRPKRVDGRRVWDRLRLDSAFVALPTEGGDDSASDNDVWSQVAL